MPGLAPGIHVLIATARPPSAHSRASGNPVFAAAPWVPAFAGTSGNRAFSIRQTIAAFGGLALQPALLPQSVEFEHDLASVVTAERRHQVFKIFRALVERSL